MSRPAGAHRRRRHRRGRKRAARWRSASATASTCWRTPIYSVISPEGCAAILWRDRPGGRGGRGAAAHRRRTALELGVIDGMWRSRSAAPTATSRPSRFRSRPDPRGALLRNSRRCRPASCWNGAGGSSWRWASGRNPGAAERACASRPVRPEDRRRGLDRGRRPRYHPCCQPLRKSACRSGRPWGHCPRDRPVSLVGGTLSTGRPRSWMGRSGAGHSGPPVEVTCLQPATIVL